MRPNRPHLRPLSALVAAGVVFAALAEAAPSARAQDAVDLQIVGNGNVKGTIRPAYERENFLVVAGRGSKIQAVAKARAKKGAFIPKLELAGPMDEILATGTTKGRATKLKTPQPFTSGGSHRIRVFGDTGADGDYQLAFTVKPQRVFSGTGTSTPAAFSLFYRFGAPAGAKARIILKPKGPGFVPALEALVPPSGGYIPISGASAGPITLDEAGDWLVGFHDGGTTGGDWTCQVVLTLPRPKVTKVDISAAALTGPFADQQPVYGRYVTPGDDEILIDPPDTGASIDGSSVRIPAGGMPYPVVITMNQSPAFPPGDGNHPAGPAVEFGPSGIVFTKDARITVPYDASQFGDPANEVEVYVAHDGGTPAKVAPRTVLDFSVPGFVTFPAPGFSTYMAASSRPRPVTGQWVVASFFAAPDADFGGRAGLAVGRLDFFQGIDQPEFYLSLSGLESEWSRTGFPPAGGPDPSARTQSAFESDNGSYFGGSGGSVDVVTLYGQNQTPTTLTRAPGGDVLLVDPSGTSDIDASFALRAAEGSPTLVTVAGAWHVIAVSAAAKENGGSPRTVSLSTEAAFGSATFTSDGRAVFDVGDDLTAESGFPSGSWAVQKHAFRGTGRLSTVEDLLMLSLPGDAPRVAKPRADEVVVTYEAPIQLLACLGGEVLLGAHTSPSQDPMLFVFVRQGRGLGKSALNGKADLLSFARTLVSDGTATVPQQLQASVLAGEMRHDGAGGFDENLQFGLATAHDAAGRPLVVPVSGTGAFGATYSLSPVGVYRNSRGTRGALAPSGAVLFGVGSGSDRFTFQIAVPGLSYFLDKR